MSFALITAAVGDPLIRLVKNGQYCARPSRLGFRGGAGGSKRQGPKRAEWVQGSQGHQQWARLAWAD